MLPAAKVAQPRYREYETIYVMRSNVAGDGAAKVAKRVEDVVAREGGKLTVVENWGRRLLAYAVKGNARGVYVYVRYVGQGALVTELERNLRMLDEVIKFQTVLVADEVDMSSLAVDPEGVQFDEVQPPDPDDVEPTLAQTLGLEIVEKPRRVEEEPSGSEASGEEAAREPVAKPSDEAEAPAAKSEAKSEEEAQ